MAAANDPAPCPDGHDDTVKLISALSVLSSTSPARAAASAPRAAGGGCCGGGCGCG
jgi:hypothetical protein